MPLPPEESLSVQSEDAVLEARAVLAEEMVVVAHPLPTMGGNMDSHVVRLVCEVAHARGLGYLRFNFRGVGRSTGYHDNGLGEGADMRAAAGKAGGVGELVLVAGYSFGAWVATRIPPPTPLLLIAPPTENYDFAAASPSERPVAMICATDDPFCLIPYVKGLEQEGAIVWWIEGADHIFTNRYVALREALAEAFAKLADHRM